MFQKARLKLTGWYLLIIMLISIFFSVAIYEVLTNELTRVERIQRLRQERQMRPAIDPEVIIETKNRLMAILILINLGILGGSSVLGYFLAGRTLRPIKDMVDEQNRFITDASHELRTPLTSLKTEIEVNLRDKDLGLIDAKKLLQSNLEDVNNLQYLSDNLIKLTQYQTQDQDFKKISILEILDEAQKKVANLAKHKNINIKNKVQDFYLEGNKQSLVEVFVILLDNAIKYSLKGKDVIIASTKIDDKVLISVKDYGIGINKEDLPHLFDRFYRVDKSRTKEISGYGLGLSIAKQIIEKHGGSIKVESKVGKGSTFSVSI